MRLELVLYHLIVLKLVLQAESVNSERRKTVFVSEESDHHAHLPSLCIEAILLVENAFRSFECRASSDNRSALVSWSWLVGANLVLQNPVLANHFSQSEVN